MIPKKQKSNVYTVYSKKTGLIEGNIKGDLFDSQWRSKNPDSYHPPCNYDENNQGVIEGAISSNSFYIDLSTQAPVLKSDMDVAVSVEPFNGRYPVAITDSITISDLPIPCHMEIKALASLNNLEETMSSSVEDGSITLTFDTATTYIVTFSNPYYNSRGFTIGVTS